MCWHLAYALFCLADHGTWLLVKLLPGTTLVALIRSRPWRHGRVSLPESWRVFLLLRFGRLHRQRSRRAGVGSSCLSRALLTRVLLDLIGQPNHLHIGMNRLDGAGRVPHAWLRWSSSDPGQGPGSEAGCHILTL